MPRKYPRFLISATNMIPMNKQLIKMIIRAIAASGFAIAILLPGVSYAKTNGVLQSLLSLAKETFGISPALANANTQFPGSAERQPRKVMTVVATAYNSEPGQTDDTPCITANGHDLCDTYATYGADNTIAANFLPMGTAVRFPELYGDQIFVVRDRMNARYGYGRIDLWLPTHQEATQFGVERMEMEIF